jgi:hypothetical protein
MGLWLFYVLCNRVRSCARNSWNHHKHKNMCTSKKITCHFEIAFVTVTFLMWEKPYISIFVEMEHFEILRILVAILKMVFPFTVHFISIKPVLSNHLSYVTIFHCSLGRSHKIGLTVSNLVHTTRFWKKNPTYQFSLKWSTSKFYAFWWPS